MSYNGWKNYETWNVNLWLSNDGSTSEQVTWMIQEGASSELYVFVIEDKLKDFVQELAEATVPELFEGGNFVLDLFNASLSQVDWQEIVENWASDLEIKIEDGRMYSVEEEETV